ncbi:MAG TPA: hypothetical protein VFO76_05905 [Candidatus Kapabacteria bacterium]|nr:hypothetical protein [Candidatus Kapabacteria bacterium]
MKIRWTINFILVGICLVGLISPVLAQFRSDNCDCPIPIGDTDIGIGRTIPKYYSMYQRLSPDAKWVVYKLNQGGKNYILNLETLKETKLEVHGDLPGEEDTYWGIPYWSNFDNDLLTLRITSYIDSLNKDGSQIAVSNIFTYRVSTSETQRITPNILGKYGEKGSVSGAFKISKDTFYIEYILKGVLKNGKDSIFHGFYVPITQSLIPNEIYPNLYFSVLGATQDSSHKLVEMLDPMPPHSKFSIFLDQKELLFPRSIQSSLYASFTPNSKLFALSANPIGLGSPDTVFPQVWIYDANDPDPAKIKVINFQCLFCKYSFEGIYAEFITDSTLAVSMHKDGDISSPLWEITIDGRIVRQLTFLPTSSVEGSEEENVFLSSLESFPNPFKKETHLRFHLNRMAYTTIGIYDVLGHQVLGDGKGKSLEAGDHEVVVDGSLLPDGSIYARIETGFGEVKTVKLVKE